MVFFELIIVWVSLNGIPLAGMGQSTLVLVLKDT